MRPHAGSLLALGALVLTGPLAAPATPAGDESREPPLLFSVSVGAVTVPATEGEAVSVAGTFQDPRVTVRPEPHRLFPYGGVSFHYPRSFTFEADLDDPAARSWTLSGNDFKVLYFAFPVVITPQTHVKQLLETHGRANCRVLDERADLRLGETTLRGIRVEVAVQGNRMIQEAYQVPLKGQGSRLLVFQDWPADGADRSKEGALALRLIAASFRTPG